jgi:Ca2+-binding RTX toxin-like protein
MSNVFGTPGNDILTGGQEADYFWARGGNDTVYGGAGDVINGEDGDDVFIATESYKIYGLSGFDTLISNYSQSNYGSGIHLNATGNFPGIQAIEPRTYLLGFDSDIEALNVTGTQYDDILDGGMKNVTLEGGAGNDALFGQEGVFSGSSGTDTLTADYNQSYTSRYGVHLGAYGENTVRRRDDGSVILTHNGIEAFNFIGSSLPDYLSGQNGDDVFDGRGGNDILEGGAGNDRLFDVSGSDTLNGGEGDDYLYTVADVKGATKQLYGGRGADTFVIDLKNQINLGFDFDVVKLGHFVNSITLPQNNGPDWQRMGIDVAFAAVGAAVGAVPVVGSLFNFWTSLAQMGVDTYLDQEELQAQIDQQVANANQAVKHYGTADWGKVSPSGKRDTIYINDFQIGLDNILLPQLPDANHFYQVDLVEGQGGGVFLSVRNPGLEQFKNVAFIANTYTNVGITDLQFKGIVADLIQGSTIGTFTKTPIVGQNNTTPETIDIAKSTFANDNIQANGGDDEVFGYYGDDLIQGGDGNDTLHGGSNQNPSFLTLESDYGNDGNDFLNGGAGNDVLNGESGNDFLNGDFGNDIVDGGVGSNTLVGGNGNDLLSNAHGSVDGGVGTDTLVADYSQMNNGAGVDVAYNNAEAIYTRINGDPTLYYSNIERFNITGTQYADVFRGGAGSDTLAGGAGNDLIMGGSGDDVLIDTDGNINGDAGNDILVADYSQMNNGAGVHVGYNNQNAIFSRLNGSIFLNYSNIERFNVTGTRYADVLQGASGGDILTGGGGNDILTGGAGADNFRFNSSNEGVDQITDFSVVDDTIQISAAEFGGGLMAGGAIAVAQFVVGASAQTASDRFIYNPQTGVLSFDIDGVGGANQTQIATLSTGLAMTNNDIFVLA